MHFAVTRLYASTDTRWRGSVFTLIVQLMFAVPSHGQDLSSLVAANFQNILERPSVSDVGRTFSFPDPQPAHEYESPNPVVLEHSRAVRPSSDPCDSGACQSPEISRGIPPAINIESLQVVENVRPRPPVVDVPISPPVPDTVSARKPQAGCTTAECFDPTRIAVLRGPLSTSLAGGSVFTYTDRLSGPITLTVARNKHIAAPNDQPSQMAAAPPTPRWRQAEPTASSNPKTAAAAFFRLHSTTTSATTTGITADFRSYKSAMDSRNALIQMPVSASMEVTKAGSRLVSFAVTETTRAAIADTTTVPIHARYDSQFLRGYADSTSPGKALSAAMLEKKPAADTTPAAISNSAPEKVQSYNYVLRSRSDLLQMPSIKAPAVARDVPLAIVHPETTQTATRALDFVSTKSGMKEPEYSNNSPTTHTSLPATTNIEIPPLTTVIPPVIIAETSTPGNAIASTRPVTEHSNVVVKAPTVTAIESLNFLTDAQETSSKAAARVEISPQPTREVLDTDRSDKPKPARKAQNRKVKSCGSPFNSDSFKCGGSLPPLLASFHLPSKAELTTKAETTTVSIEVLKKYLFGW